MDFIYEPDLIFSELFLLSKKHCGGETDPDGIRTRVAAVKGLCPRPLDDRAPPFGNTSKVVDNRVFRQANRGLLVKKTG